MPRAALALLAVACTNTIEVNVPGESPTASILDPIDVSSVEVGPLALLGRVSDAQDAPVHLFAAWDLKGPDGWERWCSAFAEDDGATRCAAEVRVDHTAVRLTAKDLAGFEGEDRLALQVVQRSPPAIDLRAPVAPGPFFANAEVEVEVVVSDADGLDGVVVTFVDNLDGALALPSTPDASGRLSGLVAMRAGDHALEAVAVDAQGLEVRTVSRFAVRADNEPPSIRIDVPRPGSAVAPGSPLVVEALALDDWAAPEALVVDVRSDVEGALALPGAGPRFSGVFALAELGLQAITVRAVDPWGAVGEATVEVRVDTPPQVTAVLPGDGEILEVGEPVWVEVRVSDVVTPSGQITVAVASDRDGPRWSLVADAGGVATAVTTLSPGQHTLAATARDSHGLESIARWTVTVR